MARICDGRHPEQFPDAEAGAVRGRRAWSCPRTCVAISARCFRMAADIVAGS